MRTHRLSLRRLSTAACWLAGSLAAGSLFLFSCKERGPSIDFSSPVAGERDTTYLAPVETAAPRHVLLEEYTGVTCPNCPAGHQTVAALQAANPGRVIAVSYYGFVGAQTNPVPNLTQKDFRVEKAGLAVDAIFGGVPALPSAAIDRMRLNPSTPEQLLVFPSSAWNGAVADRLPTPSAVNLTVASSEYTEASREVRVTIRAAYTAPVVQKHNLSLMLVENNLVDAQEYPDRIDTFYTFKHVLRDFVTPISGVSVLDLMGTKEAGRVYERTFVYTVPAGWNVADCSWVAVLHSTEAGSKEVLAAAQAEVL